MAEGRRQVRDDLTKPFYVPLRLRYRFPTVGPSGYLPPIERPERPDDSLLVDELLETVAEFQRRLTALESQPKPPTRHDSVSFRKSSVTI